MLTEEQKDTLALYGVPGVGAKTHAVLVACFGSPAAVFSASKRQLMEIDGIGTVTANNILAFDGTVFLKNQIKRMEKAGATILTRSCDGYPVLLNAFKSAPPVLFVRGNPESLSESSIAFVGTRKPTEYGIKMTRKLVGGSVDAGLCIISGIAAGIDSTSHRAALDRGGKTVAVFGCGVDNIYPSENRKLSGDIVKSGCLISHFPMGTACQPGNFPARNAVIVGLSLGTVVVEAPAKSGALITAELTLKAGRKLFTVPGNIDSPKSEGTNTLISRGAYPVVHVDNILSLLGKPLLSDKEIPVRRYEDIRPLPPGLAGEILKVLSKEPLQIEAICDELGNSISDILNELTMLEMDNYVTQKPGKIFERI